MRRSQRAWLSSWENGAACFLNQRASEGARLGSAVGGGPGFGCHHVRDVIGHLNQTVSRRLMEGQEFRGVDWMQTEVCQHTDGLSLGTG